MDDHSDEEEEIEMLIKEPLLYLNNKKGGLRTMPFIIANEAFEKLASFGLSPNMILYLMNQYHLEMTTGSNMLFFWSAATNFTPVVGAFVADSFVGRFRMIGFGSIVSLLGTLVLWLTAMIPQSRPPPCVPNNDSCRSSTTLQLMLLCFSFALISIGAGGIRSSSMAFGADQLDQGGILKNAGVLERYFSWYYASAAVSVMVAFTCVVYIQDNMGWEVGFGVPMILMFVAAISFFLASPFYIKLKAKSSLLTGFAQVIVASYRKRYLELPSESKNMLYHHKKGSILVVPSSKLRFLNKACIIEDPQEDFSTDGKASDPWRLCNVDQVEELKALLKVIPLWSTGVLMAVNTSQTSFPILQANSMNRNITSSFEIPAGSFGLFAVVSLTLWLVLYDHIILPLASRIRGKPVQFNAKQRMGFGIFVSFLSMVVAAIVESCRRSIATKEGYSDGPQATVNMSAMWLVPQNCLVGLAEGFNAIAQNEFYFSEFPRSMSSIASTLFGVGMSVANLVASSIMNAVDSVTRRGGNESWVSSNINKGHYDYYYWLLAGLSLLNLMYFLLCSSAYDPCVEESKIWDEEDEIGDK